MKCHFLFDTEVLGKVRVENRIDSGISTIYVLRKDSYSNADYIK
jgi:hypothetical protein